MVDLFNFDREDQLLVYEPNQQMIEEIKNGKLYTRATDEETSLQRIVRYEIEME